MSVHEHQEKRVVPRHGVPGQATPTDTDGAMMEGMVDALLSGIRSVGLTPSDSATSRRAWERVLEHMMRGRPPKQIVTVASAGLRAHPHAPLFRVARCKAGIATFDTTGSRDALSIAEGDALDILVTLHDSPSRGEKLICDWAFCQLIAVYLRQGRRRLSVRLLEQLDADAEVDPNALWSLANDGRAVADLMGPLRERFSRRLAQFHEALLLWEFVMPPGRRDVVDACCVKASEHTPTRGTLHPLLCAMWAAAYGCTGRTQACRRWLEAALEAAPSWRNWLQGLAAEAGLDLPEPKAVEEETVRQDQLF